MADYKNLEARIKVHEGFRNTVYLDTLKIKLLGGATFVPKMKFGTKIKNIRKKNYTEFLLQILIELLMEQINFVMT